MKKLLILALCLTAGCCLQAKKNAPSIEIIPQPESITVGKGSFKIKGANFNYDSTLDPVTVEFIAKLADDIYVGSGRASSLAAANGVNSGTAMSNLKGVYFFKDASMKAEAYKIEITNQAIKVTASDHNGFLYSIYTLRQMLPVELWAGKTAAAVNWSVPCCTIQDSPRFPYRGIMLDCARHFYNVEQVKRFLDLAAMYKINRFHWHLTEDQGWRVEIKKYPELIETGAFRAGTQRTTDRSKHDGKRYGGYYTQEQIKDIVAYAGKLGITVIPEVDLPGHMLAAMASYPWLGCTGGPYQVWTRWGVSDQVLCVGKEKTFDFLFSVLDEMCELFPGEYFHIGGDECPKKEWEKCPFCQAKIAELGLKDGDGFTKEQRLQNYVTKRVQDFLATKGKRIIGWDEILEGDLEKGATVMSWRGTKGGIQASRAGFDVIMSPTNYCYLDYKQGVREDDLAIGAGYPKRSDYDAKNLYSYEPTEGFEPGTDKHILGVQGNVWTEWICNDTQLYYMVIPRLQALSEVQWTSQENRNYERFEKKMTNRHFKIMEILGLNYRPF